MLLIKVEVAKSPIHGQGIFALQAVRAGEVLWLFNPTKDSRIPILEADKEAMHFGYVNPQNLGWFVICCDEARFWNFSATPNCGELWPATSMLEAPIVALCDIAPGDELTIGFDSDADSARKLSNQS